MWYKTFCKCIVVVEWKVFVENFLPAVRKMANINHAAGKRNAASQIIIAATNFAATNKLPCPSLIHSYLDLCQDIDTSIRINMLKNLDYLFKQWSDISTLEQFHPEVLLITQHS